MKNYLGQVYTILPKGSFDVEYNSTWLSRMSFQDVLELATHVSVQQLIARSMFRERMEKGKTIGLHEFLYPLMQGYDSVAMKIDGEVGGSDQMFNMLVGRDLEKKLLNKEKLVFGTRLLVDAESGKKMSKTEGGLISLSDPAQDMFRGIMETVPDEMIATVFELCTEKDWGWINENKSRTNTDPLKFKKELAFEIVRMYHNEQEAKKAQDEWIRVVSQKEKPSDIEEVKIKSKNIIEVLVETKLASSKSEAKRLIEQKGVKVDDVVASEAGLVKTGNILQVGKRKFVRIK
jgi:tyrosyl-tRNA synthetase